VTITERGKPAYVLLSYAAYERLMGRTAAARVSLVDRLRMDDDFDLMEIIPPRRAEPARDPFADWTDEDWSELGRGDR